MNIFVNERLVYISGDEHLRDMVARYKPDADVLVKNGCPATPEEALCEGDRIVLIKRGEIPTADELEFLMAARHTPGVLSRLKKAIVGIAGCGGLGSNIAVSLARVGVGHLIIADFDVVEPSNLNRQQYFVDQIGRLKVDALRENIARINPGVMVIPHSVKLDSENLFRIFPKLDVLVEAFDRADQKAMLVETVARFFPALPVVLGLGMAGWGGNNLLRTRRSGNLYICGDGFAEAAPAFGLMAPRVGVVANMQANQVMEILLGSDAHIQETV
ncbi:MAG: sulfur carrier protein ThiS adenylyltransferase ThiF [Candidatus Ozemobacteraceae bacterium]